MGVLESVLAYKARKEEQELADINAIPTGIKAFTDAKQMAQTNLLQKLTYNMALSKFNLDAQKQPYELANLEADTASKQATGSALSQFFGGNGDSGSGGIQASEATVGGVKFVKPEVQKREAELKNEMAIELERQKKAIAGPGAESGRVALANESIKNIDDVISTLFPKGTEESFDKQIAFGSNLPGVSLPLVGRVTPQVRPDNPLDKSDDIPAGKSQEVFRKMGASLSARQLIQTGVAARPEETAKLVSQFSPRLTSNPKEALKGLQELKSFYQDYLKTVDPTGAKMSGKKESTVESNTDLTDLSKLSTEELKKLAGI